MGEYKSDTYCASCRDNPLQQVITFSIGPAWSNNGKTQTLILQPDLEKTYSATFHSNILPYGELFFGFQKRLNSILYNQLGLEIAGGGEAKLRGDIWEDADPDFNNYRYTYAISELRVMARTKFLIDINYYGTMPYLTAGVGVGLNKSSGFAITPKIEEEVAPPPFNASTKTVVTYAFGVGLQESISDNWKASIGYEFANWGTSQLSKADGQTMGSGLIINNVYINSVLISLTYIA